MEKNTEKIVLVTGASRGIGAEIAEGLAGLGGTVFINYKQSKSHAEAVAKAVEAQGARAVLCAADVTREDEVDGMFKEVERQAGRLDTLVVNAGAPFRFDRIQRMSAADFEAQWRVQAFSAFLCLRRALALFPKGGADAVFVLSGTTVGAPPAGSAGYISAKYALWGLARSLAAETLKKGLRVHCVSPGMVETDFIKDFPRMTVEAVRKDYGGKLLSPQAVLAAVRALLMDHGQPRDPENVLVAPPSKAL